MNGWSSAHSTAENGTLLIAQEPRKASVSSLPSPPTISPRLRLSTIGDCKREIAKLYREVRRGELASTEAARLVWMLNTLANMIADHELEARVEALETNS